MASHLATLGNPREMLLVLVTVLYITGVSAIMSVPDIPGTPVQTSIAPVHTMSSDHGGQVAGTTADASAPTRALETATDLIRTEPAPVERFMGEGVGRKSPLATSRDDKRAYLLETTATVRGLAHGGCKLSERPLGGSTRRCASATETTLIAVSPGVGN